MLSLNDYHRLCNELLQAKGYGRQTDHGFICNDREIARQVAVVVASRVTNGGTVGLPWVE
jgi:hypothetical protein